MSRGNKRGSNVEKIYGEFDAIRARKYATNSRESRLVLLQRMYVRILTELSANRFKWEGLPESVSHRFLELTLFEKGLSVFYFNKKFDCFLSLRAAASGRPNFNDDPISFQIYGNDMVNHSIKATDCVPIWANYLRMPDTDIVYIYATKLADLDLTIEINMKNARRTKVVVSTDVERLTNENINRQIELGAAHVHVQQALGQGQIAALDLGVDPKSIEALHILKVRLWSECMTMLGIDNANQDKKERLVAAEVDANSDQVAATRNVALNERKNAAAKITKKWPQLGKITVDYNTEQVVTMPNPNGIEVEAGANNG